MSDLTDSMKDAEIYPVSFFSQAFDLMQKIQGGFHTLEADQVETFASQMKKHQALILSVHRQVRNMEGLIPPPMSATPPASPAPASPVMTPAPAPMPTPAPETKQRPARVTTSGQNFIPGQNEVAAKPAFPSPAPAPFPAPGAASAGTGTQDAPETKTPAPDAAPKRPARPVPHSPSASETARTTEKSTITIPVTHKENLLRPSGTAVKNSAERDKTPDVRYRNVSNGIPAEGAFPPSVNDAIEKRMLSDLRSAFSLNDRFRYRRELFRGNEEVMNRIISMLNNKESYKESVQFLEETLHWDFSNPSVKDFMKILELRFL
jgi:hypothetical protein